MKRCTYEKVHFKDAMRLYPKNDTVKEHNALKLADLVARGNEKMQLVAGHGQVGQYGVNTTGNISPNDIPKEADNCGGLADIVEVAMDARIMLRRNVCTADGLINGAMGTIVGFEWPQGQRTANTQPSGISVLFDNCKVGRMTRNSTEHTPTVLRPVTSTFKSRNSKLRLERYQYPIVLAWAVTIHKVQGLSLDRAVMDLGKNVFAHGMAYVALSRVKSLEGVCVIGLSRTAFQKNDIAVRVEYQRLANLNLM